MKKNREKGILIGILSIMLLAGGCNNDAEEVNKETSETSETGEENREEEIEESTEPEEIEEPEEAEEPEETFVEIDPVIIEHDMWHFNDGVAYEVFGEVGPVIRDGDYAILPFMLDSDSDSEVSFRGLFDVGLSTGEGISAQQGYDIRLIDSQEETVSHIGVLQLEDEIDTALQTFIGDGSRNQQMTIGTNREPARYFAVFAAPESDSVHVMLTGELGIIENVPVIDRQDVETLTFEDLEEDTEEPENESEENMANVVPTVDEIIESELNSFQYEKLSDPFEGIVARAEPFESYRESVETTVSRVDEIDHSTLILSGDVLFDSDSSDLTDEADAELEAVNAELEGTDGGELEIVGHTDNVDTEEYNQQLSEERAESVLERLRELMDADQFDDVTMRGESFREPIADNDSEEGRAQNRRVEIHFTPPTEEIVIEETGELPEPLGEEAEYPDTVQTRYGEIEIQSIRRVDDLLFGKVRVRPNEEGDSAYDALTQLAGIGARGWHSDDAGNYNQWSVYSVTLLHGDQRYYPIDYYLTPLEGSHVEEQVEEGDDVNFIVPLADRNVSNAGRLGEEGFYTATVVWPAVNAEEVTVDLTHSDVFGDHEGQIERTAPWRIMNVPVEEASSQDSELNDEDADEEEE